MGRAGQLAAEEQRGVVPVQRTVGIRERPLQLLCRFGVRSLGAQHPPEPDAHLDVIGTVFERAPEERARLLQVGARVFYLKLLPGGSEIAATASCTTGAAIVSFIAPV